MPDRLVALRAELTRCGLDGFIIPRADEHQGGYVAPASERLKWLRGFSGSAGMAVVLADRAALFIDGRYTLQAGREVDTERFSCQHLVEQPPSQWIAANLPPGARLGYDPWLHTFDSVRHLAEACELAGGHLHPCEPNPLDAVWSDRPPPPLAPVTPHSDAFTGITSAQKRHEVTQALCGSSSARQIDAVVLSAPDSIAWLLNIRGRDVPYSPLPLGFAILHADERCELFIDPRKVPAETLAHLGPSVQLEPPAAIGPALDALGQAKHRVRYDNAGTPMWIVERLRLAGARLNPGVDPCALPKACKNRIELKGARAAHRRDGLALTRFLAWLAHTAPAGGLTEIGAAARLEAFRAEGERFQGLSFPTISGAGPNGAVVHYRATPDTDRALAPDMLYLVDSGAQYLDGTTDVTRTVAIGKPTEEQRRRFTQVLKGHIALASIVFPAGTTGSQLDVLARCPLWADGVDYDHGTGHGVGSYLGVHEGPQRISKIGSTVALRPGMILSNEPGYYKADEYGIRIENLVAVIEAPAPPGAERPLLTFETLTLAPIDRALIVSSLLSSGERKWLDAYHQRVCLSLTPELDSDTAAWLAMATAPV
ncbi:MAG: aminopeptidase P family protein [Alphaproteobacteria bacterium]|nr:aminopeptidase P family protein [Alphaproteobacteria bacterium]